MKLGRLGLRLFVALVLLYLIVPTLIVIPLSFSPTSLMRFPLQGFSLRWYEAYWNSSGWMSATLNSLVIAVLTPCIAVPVGSLAAYGLVRGTFVGRKTISFLMLLPLIVPSLITAIAVFQLFSRLHLTGAVPGFVLGHSVLAMPFVVTIMTATLKGVDPQVENAAMTLGASRLRTVRLITLPMAAPGILAAALFSFLISFDELLEAMFLSTPLFNTLPKKLWDGIRLNIEPTLAAVSTIVVLVSLVVLAIAGLILCRSEAGKLPLG